MLLSGATVVLLARTTLASLGFGGFALAAGPGTVQAIRANDFLESLERIAAENAPSESGAKRYAVSSWFLHESFKKLTADQDEQFFFITGAEVEGVLVLDQWAEFAHQRRHLLARPLQRTAPRGRWGHDAGRPP